MMANGSAGARRRGAGFTVHELLIAVCIAGAVALSSAGLWRIGQETVLTTAANELVAHLALARSEAIKRSVAVRMCPSADGAECLASGGDYTFWQRGWLVYADADANGRPGAAEILRLHAGAGDRVVIRTSRSRPAVSYQPVGTAGGSTITFAVCDARDPQRARYVTISNTGRARVSRTTTSSVRCR
ncbi:MAG TPA: GspH/FimT family pseudopilin [Burkholderiales bacterium]